MCNTFIKTKLGNILSIKRGTSLSGEYYATSGDKIRLTLGNFNYPNGGFKINTAKDNLYFNGEVKSEYILKKDAIITPLTEQVAGLLGETARIPESNKYIQSGDIALVIPNTQKLDDLFAYYLISSNTVKKQLGAAAQQTKIRHTSPQKIEDCTVWLPEDTNVQHNIGYFLDLINKKITLNNKINSELEYLAKTLYDYWFVQFDFPDEFGRPYKSSGGKMVYNEVLKREIAANFELKYVKDFLDVVTGKEDANFSTENGEYAFFTCGDEILKCDKPAFGGKSILIAGNGNFNIKYFDGEFNAYQRTYVLTPKEEKYIGLLYLSALNRISAFTKGSNGSIVKFITKGDVENIPILLPQDRSILNTFNKLLDKQNHIKQENEKLTNLRDFLLPMLMNGQVTITD